MSSPNRLHVVDALRGFAIVSIMLLHNIEHFDFYYLPENLPAWLVTLDKGVWDTLFFLFGGKSYAIFALLFGLTYFIQTDNQQEKRKRLQRTFCLAIIAAIRLWYYQFHILHGRYFICICFCWVSHLYL